MTGGWLEEERRMTFRRWYKLNLEAGPLMRALGCLLFFHALKITVLEDTTSRSMWPLLSLVVASKRLSVLFHTLIIRSSVLLLVVLFIFLLRRIMFCTRVLNTFSLKYFHKKCQEAYHLEVEHANLLGYIFDPISSRNIS